MRDFPSYKNAFWGFQRGIAFNSGDLNIGMGDEQGGFFLPSENEAKFREEQKKANVFREIASVLYIGNAESKIKTVPPTGDAAFVPPGVAIPEDNMAIVTYMTKSHKIAKVVKVSREMLHDSGFDIEGALAADFGKSFGHAEEKACILGDGDIQPFGVLHPTEGAEVGLATSGTLTFDDVRSLYFSLDARYRKSAIWLMSDETAMHIRALKDSSGSHVWNDFADTIFSRPVLTSQFMPGIATGNKPVIFGDFSYYWLMERAGVTLRPLVETYAQYGITAFIGTTYVDGRLVRREAVVALEVV